MDGSAATMTASEASSPPAGSFTKILFSSSLVEKDKNKGVVCLKAPEANWVPNYLF